MPWWNPEPIWEGEDVYVIGGGPSLRQFDWDIIRGKNTVGCNGAYLLGSDVVKFLVFSDFQWWDRIGRLKLPSFGGMVVACVPKLHSNKNPWVHKMPRHGVMGFAGPGCGCNQCRRGEKSLGCPGNTGGVALNLALHLGAQRVFLLGFDMKLAPMDEQTVRLAETLQKKFMGRPNWHDDRYEGAQAQPYDRFKKEFERFAPSIPRAFPGREVWNVTNDSALETFLKLSLEDHFHERKDEE
jgi:hypothetical protein